jgi:hypothetical protein
VSAVTVPWLAACAVLTIAGAAKLRRPDPTVGALRAARLPASPTAVRALAAGEMVLSVAAALTSWWPLAVAVAVLYVAFAVFVQSARRRGGMAQTCGCFGSPDVPATGVHVVVNVAAAIAATTAIAGAGTVGDLVGEGGAGVVAIGLVALATYEVIALLTVLPRARFGAVTEVSW